MKVAKLCCTVLVLLAIGCGGGGGGQDLSTVEPQANMRLLQSGDYWEYELIGTLSDGSAQRSFSGSATRHIVSDVFDGQNVMKMTESISLKTKDGILVNTVTTTWFRQTTDRAVEVLAKQSDSGIVKRLLAPAVEYPGTWFLGLSLSAARHYDNGETENKSLAVVGTQRKSVPAGTFNVWKTVSTTTGSPATTRFSSVLYFDPLYGCEVSETGTLVDEDYTLELTTKLKRTNVRP